MSSASPEPSEPRLSPFGWPLVAIVAAGTLLRLGLIAAALASPGATLDDPDNYLPLARSLAEGRGLALEGRPTAYRPPLYPLLLAPLVAGLGGATPHGIAALHASLGAATIALTALTARRWGLGLPRILAAAAIVAFDPVLVSQARAVMTETLAAFLTAATLAALARDDRLASGSILGGIGFGLSALCRPSAWPGALLTIAARLAFGRSDRRRPGWRRYAPGVVLAASTLATAAPWAIRNARVFGEPILTTTHGGYTLALANNPTYYREVVHGPPGAVWTGHNQWLWWDSVNRAYRGLGEPEADRRIRRDTVGFILSHPASFARAGALRLEHFWALAPAAAVYPTAPRVATAAWTLPLWLALAVGLSRSEAWRWPRAAATLNVVGLSCVHLFFWTDLRMRAPIVPAIALIAATAQVPGFVVDMRTRWLR